ncbi:MAG: threonine synthase [Candidatus Cloacimonadota bacterium]
MKRRLHFSHWQCTSCGKRYARDEVAYLCPTCSIDYRPGMPLVGVLEAWLDYPALAQELDFAEYRKLSLKDFVQRFSVLENRHFPPLPVGETPFFPVRRLVEGMTNLWIKNDSLLPSGSFKDRASVLMVAEARRLGISKIACASTGNAASSLAALCASCGIQAVIFAPASAPQAKLIQIKAHGAELHEVDGTYDDAFKAALEYSAAEGCLNRNTAYHPLTIEGKKSSGLEIFWQNGFKVPDWIVVPVGDGVILAGIHKAFADLKRTGLIDKLPRLLAVQAESSDAITSYWESGAYKDAKAPATVADSISVKTPSNAHWAVRALKESGGAAIRVTDTAIAEAQLLLASRSGVFAEPSSAATLAGLEQALSAGIIKPEEQVVLLITGHGLKDTASFKV